MKKFVFLICFALIFPAISFGQNKDSLLRKAEIGIYENPDKSLETARSLLKNEKDPDKIISIYLVLSNAYIAKRNFDESLKYSLKAKELVNESDNIEKKIAVLISIAVQYQQMELFNKSLETLDEADDALKSFTGNDFRKHFEIAKCFAIRGMIYKSQNNSEIALEKFLFSIQNFEKAKQTNPTFANMSVVFYNIGYCYLDLSQIQKAESYFIKSKNYAEKLDAKSLEAFALKGLAETYTLNGRHDDALKLLENSSKLSENVGDLVLNEGIYKGMADNYLALNDFQKYRLYNKKFLETRFEREQSELNSINRSIDTHTQENLKKIKNVHQKYLVSSCFLFAAGLVIITVLVFFIRKRILKNKEYQKEIQKLIHS